MSIFGEVPLQGPTTRRFLTSTDRLLPAFPQLLRKREPTAFVRFLILRKSDRPDSLSVFLFQENADRSTLEQEFSCNRGIPQGGVVSYERGTHVFWLTHVVGDQAPSRSKVADVYMNCTTPSMTT